MDIQVSRSDGVLIVVPAGRIDSTTSADLERGLQHELASGDRRVLVDFAAVEYISSAGLRVALALAKRLRDANGALVLCTLGPPVRQVFELAGLLGLFTVEATREAALTRLAE